MDPITTLGEMIGCQDRYRRAELRGALNGWIAAGGFAPRVYLRGRRTDATVVSAGPTMLTVRVEGKEGTTRVRYETIGIYDA